MERITLSMMNDYFNNYEMKRSSDEEDFEKFVNYTILSKEYNTDFDIDEITVGDGGDTAIDGIAILCNGKLVTSIEDVQALLDMNKYLDVKFIFIQSKTSGNFESAVFHNIAAGINDFFSETPQLVRNENIEKYADIGNFIYNNAAQFREQNPILRVFYVTTGVWTEDKNLVAAKNRNENLLKNTNLFSSVKIIPIDRNTLQSIYRKSKETISTTINFPSRTTLPSIPGITQAYIGIIPGREFLKIIHDDEGNMLNVFEDNVRDFQGDVNIVNTGISQTLSGTESQLFTVLNNGITIVASEIRVTADSFTVRDYQIVNGCQTSNVISKYKDKIESVNIPIKLIATENDEIKNRITIATNSQTQIKKEQLTTLTNFQRSLESFFQSFPDDAKLYYERRNGQYKAKHDIAKSRIISIQQLIRSYASMFLERETHNCVSYYAGMVVRIQENKLNIFQDNHNPLAYYTSSYSFYKLDSFFRRRAIDKTYIKARFHILMVFRIVFGNEKVPYLTNKKQMDALCSDLLDILYDEDKALEAFNTCIDIIENSKVTISTVSLRMVPVTEKIITEAVKFRRKK